MTSVPVRSKFATDAIARYAKATNAKDGGAKFGAAYDKAKQARTATAASTTARPAATTTAASTTAKPAAKSMVSDARRAELSANYKKNYAAAMAPFKDRIATKNAAKAAATVKKATGGYVTKPTFKW